MFDIIRHCCLVTKLRPALLQPQELQPARLLCPWDFPGKNTRVGCQFLLQGSFWRRDRTRVSCVGRWILYHRPTWEAQLAIREMQIETTMRYYWHRLAIMTKILKIVTTLNTDKDMEKPLRHHWLRYKMTQLRWKMDEQFWKNTKCEVAYSPVTARLGTYSTETKLVFTQKPTHEGLQQNVYT